MIDIVKKIKTIKDFNPVNPMQFQNYLRITIHYILEKNLI